MKFGSLVVIAARALGRNKLRSSLTMLGVIIGVASVVTMVSVGQGASESVKSAISRMGSNILYVVPGSVSSGGVHYGSGSKKTLTPGDVEAIVKEIPSVRAASGIVRERTQVVVEERNWVPGSLEGVDVSYAEIMNWPASEGRWFNEQEVRGGAKVCLLGKTVVKELFPHFSPVGEMVRIGNVPVRVIGVLSRRGSNAWGQDQDDAVIMPWTTVRMRLAASEFQNVDRIAVSAVSENAIARAEREITRLLRERHRIREGGTDDFHVRNLSVMADSFSETSRVMTMLLAAIASISLVVGGIGIMNIMLVSVSERTREIGIRMAVGARGKDILVQFLVEAVVLSIIGGIVGILLGVGASRLVSIIAKWPTLISVDSMILAMLFSSGIGIIFGYYPAWRASRLDPIECLRYE